MNVVAEAVDGEEAVTLSRLRNSTLFCGSISICLGWMACKPLAASRPRFLKRGSSCSRPVGMKLVAGLRRNMVLMRSFLGHRYSAPSLPHPARVTECAP